MHGACQQFCAQHRGSAPCFLPGPGAVGRGRSRPEPGFHLPARFSPGLPGAKPVCGRRAGLTRGYSPGAVAPAGGGGLAGWSDWFQAGSPRLRLARPGRRSVRRSVHRCGGRSWARGRGGDRGGFICDAPTHRPIPGGWRRAAARGAAGGIRGQVSLPDPRRRRRRRRRAGRARGGAERTRRTRRARAPAACPAAGRAGLRCPGEPSASPYLGGPWPPSGATEWGAKLGPPRGAGNPIASCLGD